MDSGERLGWEIAREIERARQNIEDILAIEKSLWLNVQKSRFLRAEVARMESLFWSKKERPTMCKSGANGQPTTFKYSAESQLR